jgi:hypothetical protein
VACLLGGLAAACTSLTGDASQPVAIEFVLGQSPPLRLEEFDTLPIAVRVRDRAGDTVPGAPVTLTAVAPDTVFGIDSAAQTVFGLRPGDGRLVASSGALQSSPLAVHVVRAPDSLALSDSGTAVDTVAATDSASAPLAVQLLDLRTDTTQATGLTGYPVSFAIVLPAFADTATATALFGDNTLATVVTTAVGAASVVVKRHGAPPQPDSVVVEASATRANGTVVAGSPVRFVVYFQ